MDPGWRCASPGRRHPRLPGLDPGSIEVIGILGHYRRMAGYVYIMASRKGGTLYVGVTNDISRRTFEHREKLLPGFTSRYGVRHLVWYREYPDISDAISDEKRIKKWRRKWKTDLIEAMNPEWDDLYLSLF